MRSSTSSASRTSTRRPPSSTSGNWSTSTRPTSGGSPSPTSSTGSGPMAGRGRPVARPTAFDAGHLRPQWSTWCRRSCGRSATWSRSSSTSCSSTTQSTIPDSWQKVHGGRHPWPSRCSTARRGSLADCPWETEAVQGRCVRGGRGVGAQVGQGPGAGPGGGDRAHGRAAALRDHGRVHGTLTRSCDASIRARAAALIQRRHTGCRTHAVGPGRLRHPRSRYADRRPPGPTFGGGVIGNTAGSGPVVGVRVLPSEQEAVSTTVATMTAAQALQVSGPSA